MFNVDANNPYALYIEDDAEDVAALNLALSENCIPLQVVHAPDGVEALNMLNAIKGYKPLPSLIILDINLPKLNGKETFICLKADKDISKVPLMVVSTSNNTDDIEYFIQQDVPYVLKPGDLDRFKKDLSEALRIVSMQNPLLQDLNTDAA